jgi:hypothetical protein
MRTLTDALCTADAVRQLKERGAKLDADMQDQLSLADEIERLKKWHAEIVALSAGWDEDGSTGPRDPLSWETVGRMAMDYARAALRPNVLSQPKS